MKEFIMHSKTAPRITVVAVLDEETNSMCFSATKCRKGEVFIKKTGVKIARERVLKNRKCLLMCDNINTNQVKEVFVENAISIIKSLQKNGLALERKEKRAI